MMTLRCIASRALSLWVQWTVWHTLLEIVSDRLTVASGGGFLFVVGLDTLPTRPTRRCLRKKQNFNRAQEFGIMKDVCAVEGSTQSSRESAEFSMLSLGEAC
uniref:Uncharacterized protein n=1 Tax=Noctiluca scintillans TaxID=2966 RepID=A0A7S1FHE5_NOCSC|mmetsp:Transcript_64582/g.170977  ORF Transcript_64582/g.170977 Transcript_64582/m.170977 type:complete len:102 (+) Transcript_64582:326-631(+)